MDKLLYTVTAIKMFLINSGKEMRACTEIKIRTVSTGRCLCRQHSACIFLMQKIIVACRIGIIVSSIPENDAGRP